MKGKRILKTCARGHTYYRSSDCPVCPKCWPGYYKKQKSDLPSTIGAPALRALLAAKITKLRQLSKVTESDLLELHGMGPSALEKLKNELHAHGLKFKKDEK